MAKSGWFMTVDMKRLVSRVQTVNRIGSGDVFIVKWQPLFPL